MTIIRKLTYQQFLQFVDDYYSQRLHRVGLRPGQAFCNTYNITDSDIFYQEDDEKALDLIEEHYVEPDGCAELHQLAS